MRNSSLISFFLILILSGCGKSPLLKKLKIINEVSGKVLLQERFENQTTQFSFVWKTAPSLIEMSTFEVKLDSKLPPGQTIDAYIKMPEMGHGSSPIDIHTEDDLTYLFSDVAFIMPGLWVLHIEILENNKVVGQWQKNIQL